jgi:hypothetical protein
VTDTATDFPAQLDRLLLYVRCGERIGAAMEQNTHTLAALNAVVTLDPTLAPEILAAVAGLSAANEALFRAHAFCTARLEVKAPE